ncbi:hypothetical protein RND81_08G026200 [Saponaria officinalis]|uniref:U1-type domain-containing protein n=1 Tax=Saponaria officinalis TaxID=3572 RepID=A0AAW1J2Q2_SAPOF
MVWFQCEACGEELKKPKLPNHFRQCSAYKLSCIDCGVTFDKQSVQSHTQCISEAEKYGPKGQVATANGSAAKPKQEKPKPDVDINVGLSNRHPWFCSLCNAKATSQQALLLHGDGKKHRAKVRAYLAKQQPSEAAVPKSNDSADGNAKTEALDDKSVTDKKENISSNGALGKENSSAENGIISAKKRKADTTDDGVIDKGLNGLGNGIADQAGVQEKPKKQKKAKLEPKVKGAESKIPNHKAETEVEKDEAGARNDSAKKKIKWKKLISSALKTAPNGALKMKKLRKLVLKNLRESGIDVDDTNFSDTLENKVNSSSKFTVDGKYVRLAA